MPSLRLTILVAIQMWHCCVHALRMSRSTSSHFLRMSASSSNSPPMKRLPTLRSLKTTELLAEESARASRLMTFIDASPEPFHVVDTVSKRLRLQGFVRIKEEDTWKKSLTKGGKYYFTRNNSSIIAFVVGGEFRPGQGFKIIGAHVDSPTLKVKPRSKRAANSGLVQINVETYGGGLWHTFFDRDLSVAGRVLVQDAATGQYEYRLVHGKKSMLRIPNLCIHLRTPDERDAFKINKETDLVPILAEEAEKTLTGAAAPAAAVGTESSAVEEEQWKSEQQPELLQFIATELNCKVGEILDFELSTYDTQNAALSGIQGEFICASRLDNLASCFVALETLEDYASSDSAAADAFCSMIALFDHEEVGSESLPGAGSTLMRDAVSRITNAFSDGAEDVDIFKAGLTKSMILSVDMAHAVHPNYAAKHDKAHSPKMNAGVVIKHNSNQRYATSGVTAFLIRELARRHGLPIQEFVVRNDCPCGSTIGPIISANTGIRAIDLGMAQLSMHSIREMMGAADLTLAKRLFSAFFADFAALDRQLSVDNK